jgi:hypothetical protein
MNHDDLGKAEYSKFEAEYVHSLVSNEFREMKKNDVFYSLDTPENVYKYIRDLEEILNETRDCSKPEYRLTFKQLRIIEYLKEQDER